jgi:CheY-like chemotaxis protein
MTAARGIRASAFAGGWSTVWAADSCKVPGTGRCFVVPFSVSEGGPPYDSRAGHRRLTATHPILVVEDNIINQKVTTLCCAVRASCDLAVDGTEAGRSVAIFRHPDGSEPPMDGFGTRAVDPRGSCGRVPIIALTAAVGGDRQLAMDAGMRISSAACPARVCGGTRPVARRRQSSNSRFSINYPI